MEEQDMFVVEEQLGNDTEWLEDNSGSWMPRPKKKQNKAGKWISWIVIGILLVSGSYFWFFRSPDFSKQAVSDNIPTEQQAMIPVGPYEDSPRIQALKEEATQLFGEMIISYFVNTDEVETKCGNFDAKIGELCDSIYQYYVVEDNGGWKQADSSMADYLQNLNYEGVKMMSSSVPGYMSRLHALEKTDEK